MHALISECFAPVEAVTACKGWRGPKGIGYKHPHRGPTLLRRHVFDNARHTRNLANRQCHADSHACPSYGP